MSVEAAFQTIQDELPKMTAADLGHAIDRLMSLYQKGLRLYGLRDQAANDSEEMSIEIVEG